jgi:hypothetical protein
MTHTAKLTYYNGLLWRTQILPAGTRVVQPLRSSDNGPVVARAEIRYPGKSGTA